MDGLVDAVASVMNGRPAELLSVDEPVLWEAELAPGYTVSDWYASADPDRRKLLLEIAAKTGFPEAMDEALTGRFHLSEFFALRCGATDLRLEAPGLGLAFLLSGIAVSLPSEEHWKQDMIPLKHVWLDQDGYRQKFVEVSNLWGPGGVQAVADELLERSREDLLREPVGLAARLGECFPHLRFGRDVDKHSCALPPSLIPIVIGKLVTLDGATWEWRRCSAMTSPALPDCRSESKPTMQKYGHERDFRDPNGEKRRYELHAVVGSSYRIHLRITYDPRGLEIGYIGDHLRTVKFH